MGDDALSRREVLRLTGAGAGLSALAGCGGLGGGEGGETPGSGDGTPGSPTDESTPGGDESDPEGNETDEEASGEGFAGEPRPVVFVHGGSGSATQFQSNAQRFASNGYAQDLLHAFEYDTSVEHEEIEAEINDDLETFLGEIRDETGAEAVNVIGHSRGTTVMHSYLGDADRAEAVANYVNVDGREAEEPPGGVRTLAIWGMGNENAAIGGAENRHFEQTHVEVATSAESFGAIYEFFHGEAPGTTAIEPEPPDEVTLAGRATIFPENAGVDGDLEVYEVAADSGFRVADEPHATESLSEDGSWGPIEVDGEARYEFVLRRADAGPHHFYRMPALRSNHFVRLQTSRPGEGIDQLIERGPDHVSLVVSRDKEFWGDQGTDSDDLRIDGVDVVTADTAPREGLANAVIAFDRGSDRRTNLDEPIPVFEEVPFITGVDVYVPASEGLPEGSVSIVSRPRDGDLLSREIRVPNFASETHRVSVELPDHVQTR